MAEICIPKIGDIIDLTYPLFNGMSIYPGDSKPRIIPEDSEKIDDPGGIIYLSGKHDIIITNHHGTHVDAPFHKDFDGKRISGYSIEKFINQCMMIDLTGTDVLQRREISLEDIEKSRAGLMNDLGALIVYTGFGDLIVQNQGKFTTRRAKTKFESTFPYFSQDAARYIACEFPRLNIVGIDSFAVDKQGSNSEVHRIFFENETLPLETLVGLQQLRPYEGHAFTLYCVPLKITGGDAAPVRAFAIIS